MTQKHEQIPGLSGELLGQALSHDERVLHCQSRVTQDYLTCKGLDTGDICRQARQHGGQHAVCYELLQGKLGNGATVALAGEMSCGTQDILMLLRTRKKKGQRGEAHCRAQPWSQCNNSKHTMLRMRALIDSQAAHIRILRLQDANLQQLVWLYRHHLHRREGLTRFQDHPLLRSKSCGFSSSGSEES